MAIGLEGRQNVHPGCNSRTDKQGRRPHGTPFAERRLTGISGQGSTRLQSSRHRADGQGRQRRVSPTILEHSAALLADTLLQALGTLLG